MIMNICLKCFGSENCCISGYLIINKKGKTRVLSDSCLGSGKGCPEFVRILTNTAVSISATRNSHNFLLMDFSVPEATSIIHD